jgi:hypothetical protein
MSDDGLSYSVATDFDKQMAQAMAEQEARTRDPRFVPGARVEQPDAPDLLRRELIDPVLAAERAYAGVPDRRLPAEQAPKTVSNKGNIFERDPLTGAWNQVVKAPEKPVDPNRIDFATRSRLDLLKSDIVGRQRALQKAQGTAGTDPITLGEMARGLRLLKEQYDSLLPKAAAPIAAAPAAIPAAAPTPVPRGIIGTQTQNSFQPGPGVPRRYKFNPATGSFE